MTAWPWHNVINGVTKTELIQVWDHVMTRWIKNKQPNSITLHSWSVKSSSNLALKWKHVSYDNGFGADLSRDLNFGLIRGRSIVLSCLTVATISRKSCLIGMQFLSLIEGDWTGWILGTLGPLASDFPRRDCLVSPCGSLVYPTHSFSTQLSEY